MTTTLAPVALAPIQVAVAATLTALAEFDTRYTEILGVQIVNLDGSQTFAGIVQRRVTLTDPWADSSIPDFSSIPAGGSVLADLDVRGTGYIRLVGTMSGAGGDVTISARRRSAK